MAIINIPGFGAFQEGFDGKMRGRMTHKAVCGKRQARNWLGKARRRFLQAH